MKRKNLHRKAYNLYRRGWSIQKISRRKSMPCSTTIYGWKKPTFECECGFHGWDNIDKSVNKKTLDILDAITDKERKIILAKYRDKDVNALAEEDAINFLLVKEFKAIIFDNVIGKREGKELLLIKSAKEGVDMLERLVKLERLMRGELAEETKMIMSTLDHTYQMQKDSTLEIDNLRKEILGAIKSKETEGTGEESVH